MMTFRSNFNPLNKDNYDNFAFKKSEILEILQTLNSNFSFELPGQTITETPPLPLPQPDNILSTNYDYKFFLFKKPLLTFHEAACIITGYAPKYVEECQNDPNFKLNFSDYLGAFEYLDSCVDAQLLPYDSYHNKLEAASFKQFLANEGTCISGYNDKDLMNIPTRLELLEENELLKNKIQHLERDLEDERFGIKGWEEDANHHIKHGHKLELELAEMEKELSALRQLPSQKNDLLSLIFDESNETRYAPDLALSIKLWEEIYILNPKEDSHSNKANNWISINTGYEKTGTSASKIREITTPLTYWSTHRDKSYKK